MKVLDFCKNTTPKKGVFFYAENYLTYKLDLRKTSPPFDNANDEVMVDLSGGGDAIASLTTEKQAGRVGGVLEGVGILRKSSKLIGGKNASYNFCRAV